MQKPQAEPRETPEQLSDIAAQLAVVQEMAAALTEALLAAPHLQHLRHHLEMAMKELDNAQEPTACTCEAVDGAEMCPACFARHQGYYR